MRTASLHRASGAMRINMPVLVLCGVLLGGCSSYSVMPKALPPVRGFDGLSLSAVSLLVVNAEKDPAEQDILTVKQGRSGFRGNRQAWSKRLVESLSRELAVRGARMRSDAPVVLSVAVPEITFSETRDQMRFAVRVVVSSSVGWAKEYEGAAASSVTSTGSMQAEADKLAGLALADAVKKMLGDPAFLVRLGSKQ
ncbi:MAG: hypothetical protein A2X58_00825 [Nitrospirae bacterium GWC2_56_14]|nr:MAG: hypothetical protein A2X58_00825 [Nitrospirae bacterium GWC2_56_14]